VGGDELIEAVIVGCGNIAERYAADLLRNRVVDLVGFHDVDFTRAERFATEFGGTPHRTLDDAIAAAGLVINLTIFESHYPVTKAALSAGRHVYTEKPLALSLDHARELGALSESRGVRLASAPFTFMGAAQALAIDWVRSGRLGEVRVVNAEVNHGRIETWHPNPEPFYAAGPMLDVGVYPLAILIAALGSVSTVRALSSTVLPGRSDLAGKAFTPASPDYWLVELVHAGGARVRLSVNFYVDGDEGITFHGDDGSLALASWFQPGTQLVHTPYGSESETVAVPAAPDVVDWSVGVAEVVTSIEEDRPSPLNRDQAVHMVDILEAVTASAAEGEPVALTTMFEPVWAREA
jgi:predicted dehydrogenase